MTRQALLIIDMQNAYFNNDALKRKQQSLIDTCNGLIGKAHKLDMPIFNLRTVHERDTSSWTRNMLADEQGYLFEGDTDAANLDGLDIAETTEMLKTRDSAFYGTALESALRTLEVTELVLCGVSTHTCVFFTAADAYARNFKVVLVKDAISSHNPDFHESTFILLKDEYRQSVTTANEFNDT